jgi:hypothetical protein
MCSQRVCCKKEPQQAWQLVRVHYHTSATLSGLTRRTCRRHLPTPAMMSQSARPRHRRVRVGRSSQLPPPQRRVTAKRPLRECITVRLRLLRRLRLPRRMQPRQRERGRHDSAHVVVAAAPVGVRPTLRARGDAAPSPYLHPPGLTVEKVTKTAQRRCRRRRRHHHPRTTARMCRRRPRQSRAVALLVTAVARIATRLDQK